MLQGSLQNCSHIAGKPNMHLDLRPNRRQAHFCIVLIEGSLEEQPPTLMSGRWRNGCVMRISWNSRSPSVHWHTSWLSEDLCQREMRGDVGFIYEGKRAGLTERRRHVFIQHLLHRPVPLPLINKRYKNLDLNFIRAFSLKRTASDMRCATHSCSDTLAPGVTEFDNPPSKETIRNALVRNSSSNGDHVSGSSVTRRASWSSPLVIN